MGNIDNNQMLAFRGGVGYANVGPTALNRYLYGPMHLDSTWQPQSFVKIAAYLSLCNCT